MVLEPACWSGCSRVRVLVGMLHSLRVSRDVSQDKTIDDGKDKKYRVG